MVDQLKRRTLKLITGASTAAVGGVVLGNTALAVTDNPLPPKESDVCTQRNHLRIQIITGKASPEDTVIFTNNTKEAIEVEEFLPGYITLNEQMMDLNALTMSGNLVVNPQYPVTSKLARWEVLALNKMDSYLWCDTAVDPLHPKDQSNFASNTNSTGIITIDAAVVNGRAMLTLDHPFAYPVFS